MLYNGNKVLISNINHQKKDSVTFSLYIQYFVSASRRNAKSLIKFFFRKSAHSDLSEFIILVIAQNVSTSILIILR